MSTNRALLELLNNLNLNNGGNVSISFGNGGTVLVSSGVTTYIGNSIVMNRNKLIINNREYDLDDPTAAERMPDADRKMFWTVCSDKGKDSDLYRKYANALLSEAHIDVNTLNNSALKLIVINNAERVTKLGNLLAEEGILNWLEQLSGLPDNQFETMIRKADEVKKLLESLRKSGNASAFTTLKFMEPVYLGVFLDSAYDTAEFLNGIYKIGYQDPVTLLMTIEIPKLKEFLKHRYDAVELMKGLVNIGYRNPLQTLLNINHDRLEQLFAYRYDSIEMLKAFSILGYQDPVPTLLSINPDTLNELFSHRYDSIELMKCLSNMNYRNPLQTLLDLDHATLLLFYQHRYDAIEILKAFHHSGKSDPVAYFNSLGKDAMITMISSRSEYVSRIKRGVDMTREFKPVNKVDNEFRPELLKFIQELARKEAYSSIAQRLEIDPGQWDDFKDSFSRQMVNIPVRLDGDLFDLDTLVHLKKDSEGYRKHPLSGEQFSLSSLQSARDVQKRLDKVIETAERLVEQKRGSMRMWPRN